MVEDERRPVKELRRRGPPGDEDAPLTCLSVPMRIGGKARTEEEWWRELGRARHLFDGMLNKTAASGRCQFDDLTDDLLRHVLSFLPAADALQTCVLDTGWRDHCRRTTSLPLIFDQSSFPSSERFKQLVKLFIHLRGDSPLDKCKIVGCLDDDDDDERTYTNTMLLIQYALKCQVKELQLSVAIEEDDDNDIEYDPLKQLMFGFTIVAMILVIVTDRTVSMRTVAVMLIQLMKFIYRWDLECCPIFDKLKTLSLNEWFTTIDLLCILQHSPVLEVLTLQLGSTEKFVRATGAEEKIEQSFVCSHLKVVNIECRKVDEGVHQILKFLSTCGILRDQISITHTLAH
ncbi:hypothetical protein TRIUR3_04525 [Triticum urartu]|uniref:F-box domain-containing protein n=1 Tax=Triticum urartu TaxID=4572 RepID=M8AI74_TRIUA|nr:hypothetical protein TRIUR3_04525 [Triticum urartu]